MAEHRRTYAEVVSGKSKDDGERSAEMASTLLQAEVPSADPSRDHAQTLTGESSSFHPKGEQSKNRPSVSPSKSYAEALSGGSSTSDRERSAEAKGKAPVQILLRESSSFPPKGEQSKNGSSVFSSKTRAATDGETSGKDHSVFPSGTDAQVVAGGSSKIRASLSPSRSYTEEVAALPTPPTEGPTGTMRRVSHTMSASDAVHVIGRQGHTSNAIQARTGVHLVIAGHVSNPMLRRLILLGTDEQILEAMQMVEGVLEPIRQNRKTRMCKFFREGGCKLGNLCTFAHGRDDLRPSK